MTNSELIVPAEYTPTTEVIRDCYLGQLVETDVKSTFEFIDEGKANAEFDRWLATVKADAWDECFEAEYNRAPEDPPLNPYRGEQA